MKLQFDEIVEHPDADLVLRTLEPYLREVSLETIRRGDELIVYGLGPSFRTMNRNDKAIVLATSQPDATMIHAEANFLASALMGDVPQDDIVRSKIERALESLKAELNSGGISRQTDSKTLQIEEPVSAVPIAEAVPMVAEVYAPPPVDAEQISPPPIEHAQDISTRSSIELLPEPKSDEPLFTAPHRSSSVPSPAEIEGGSGKKKPFTSLLLLSLLVLLLIVAGYFMQYRRASQSIVASKAKGQTTIPSAGNITAAHVPPSSPSLAGSGQSAPNEMPKDVKTWVQAWAAAMRSRDVQSQLSFYATPLDRYFLTPDVSREQLLKDKQAEIDDRKGLWTLKAEDVVVDKQTATNAVVMLIKHIIVELPSSTIHEQRIKTQLKLKMVDGGWKITSERIIG